MDNNQVWYTSRTIWAGIVTVIASLLSVFHVNLGVEAQAGLVDGVLAVVTAVSGAYAIYGRVKADTKIGKN